MPSLPSRGSSQDDDDDDRIGRLMAKHQGREVSNWGASSSRLPPSSKRARRARDLVDDDDGPDSSFQFDTSGDLSTFSTRDKQAPAATSSAAQKDTTETKVENGLLLPSNVQVEQGEIGRDAVELSDDDHEADGKLGDFVTLDRGAGAQTTRYWEAEEEQERKAHEVCVTCGETGHDKRSCSHVLCLACGALDEHATRECAQGLTCFRCGERGHRLAECKQPRRMGGGARGGWAGRECMRCGSVNHLEASCPTLWRLYYYSDEQALEAARAAKWQAFGRKTHRGNTFDYRSDDGHDEPEDDRPPSTWDPAERWCYNCAARGSHWGDTCPLPRCNFAKPTGEPSAYSEYLSRAGPHAARYVRSPPPPGSRSNGQSLAARIDQFQVGQNASMHIVDLADDGHMTSKEFARRKAKEEQSLSKKERLQKRLQDEAKERELAREALKSGGGADQKKRKRGKETGDGDGGENEAGGEGTAKATKGKKQRQNGKSGGEGASTDATAAAERREQRAKAHEALMKRQQEAKRERREAQVQRAKEEKQQRLSTKKARAIQKKEEKPLSKKQRREKLNKEKATKRKKENGQISLAKRLAAAE